MSLMDSETGEILLQDINVDCANFDVETGEKVIGYESEDEIDDFNLRHRSTVRKSKFNIPKSYLNQNEDSKKENLQCYLSSQEYFSLADKKKVIDLKEEIVMGYNKFSHRLFLIPSFFLFPKIGAIYIILVELFLHIWSHKKNNRNKDPNVYYRSPLHSLTAHFCNFCRETKDLQDRKNHQQQDLLRKYHQQKFVATS